MARQLQQPGDHEGYVCGRKVGKEYMCCIVCSILAQLTSGPSHGTISNKTHVHDSAWPATHGVVLYTLSQVSSQRKQFHLNYAIACLAQP